MNYTSANFGWPGSSRDDVRQADGLFRLDTWRYRWPLDRLVTHE